MAQMYVDLTIASGGDGSLGNPWGVADFLTDLQSANVNDYKVKGKGSTAVLTSNILIGHATTIESWLDTPAILQINRQSTQDYDALIGLQTGSSLVNIKRMGIQLNTSGTFIVFSLSCITVTANGQANFENCVFQIKSNTAVSIVDCIFGALSSKYTANGCITSAIGTPGTDSGFGVRNSMFYMHSDTTATVDTCYLEGNSDSLFYSFKTGSGAAPLGIYKNSAFFNINGFTAVSASNQPTLYWSDGSNNIDEHTSASQLGNLADIMTITLPGSLRPLNDSTIINSGDPSLGVTYDLFNIPRTYNPNPDIGAAEYVGSFGIDPTFKSFGDVIKNSTTDQTLTITNVGASPISLGSLTGLSSPFSIINDFISDSTINSGDSSTAVIRYNPSSLGISSGTLDVTSNDPVTPNYLFNVDGTCQQAIIGLSPTFKSFGDQTKNSTLTQVLTISNTGNIPLIISGSTGLSAPFSLSPDMSGVSIAGSSSSDTTITYHPTALDSGLSQTLTITSNDPVTPSSTFIVDGTCQQAIISISPTLKHFGAVAKSSTNDQTVTVSNIGNINLNIGTLTGLAAPYSLVNNNVSGATIHASDSSTVVVRYHPTVIGYTSDTLIIPSNDLNTPYNFTVDGTSQEADISVSPLYKSFLEVQLGQSSSSVVTVTNIGNINLVMQPVTDPGLPFIVTNDNVSDATIAPSGSATVTVTFAPTSVGYFTDSIIFNSNDPNTSAYTFNLYGTGINKTSVYATGRTLVGNNIYDYLKP